VTPTELNGSGSPVALREKVAVKDVTRVGKGNPSASDVTMLIEASGGHEAARWPRTLPPVETVDGNLWRGMRQLNGVYTQRFNRRHGLVGHLFQGRYKAILVQKDTYLLELTRYVVLNPVRARMVADPAEWPWSNYRAVVGEAPAPRWLDTDWLLGQFGGSECRRSALIANSFWRARARRAA
ncbi:MAG: transposase, partial [Gammaproteobacteria bacterium]